MSWSKVTKDHRKPLRWWRYKLLCEYYYHVGNSEKYHKYLNYMCHRYGFNLYGELFFPGDWMKEKDPKSLTQKDIEEMLLRLDKEYQIKNPKRFRVWGNKQFHEESDEMLRKMFKQ